MEVCQPLLLSHLGTAAPSLSSIISCFHFSCGLLSHALCLTFQGPHANVRPNPADMLDPTAHIGPKQAENSINTFHRGPILTFSQWSMSLEAN